MCRTPWCDAPIRHSDHIQPYSTGGPTTLPNAQGLCARCNQTKEAAGWRSEPIGGGGIRTVSPTEHRYLSVGPPTPTADLWRVSGDVSSVSW